MASSNHKAPASKFMPSGYDYEFVLEVPEEYICNICFSPMWKPVQTKCGHRFCKDCLEEANKRKNPPQCPEDRQELRKNQDVFEDKAAERRILSFVIKCPNEECPWQGELGDFKDHTCNPVHKNLAVICPNKCGQKIKKDEISNHVSQHCALTFVPCVYHRFGCNVKAPRKDMNKHMEKSIGHHFNITCERLLLLEDENRKLKINQKEVEQQVQNLKGSFIKEKEERMSMSTANEEQISMRLDKAIQSLENQKGEFTKEMRTLKQQMKQQADEQATNTENVRTMKEELNGNIERSRMRMQASINQVQRDIQDQTKKSEKDFYFVLGILFIVLCVIGHRELEKTSERCSSELQHAVSSISSRLSHKIFNMDNFDAMLKQAKNTGKDNVHHEVFYNKKHGYKFKVSVYPNGYGEGKDTHVSLHIQMIRGKYDAILPWPFTEKIKISILHQRKNIQQRSIVVADINPTQISRVSPKYFQKPVTTSNKRFVFDQFVSHRDLRMKNLLSSDSLFVEIEFESV